MSITKKISADRCSEVCVETYIKCTQRKYTGCVEEIRVCREECSATRSVSQVMVRYIRALGA